MRVRREHLALAGLVVLLVGTGARAEEAATGASAQAGKNDLFQSLSLGSRKEPIQINADALELDYKGSTILYHGNVQVTQGDVTLTSDRLTISYDPAAVRQGDKGAQAGPADAVNGAGRIKEIVAEGKVRIRQQQRLAEGRRAVFDQAKQTIVISDDAVLHDGPNTVAGERVVVYLQEERSVVEGGSNSRVKAVFYPGQEPTPGAPVQAARSDAPGRAPVRQP